MLLNRCRNLINKNIIRFYTSTVVDHSEVSSLKINHEEKLHIPVFLNEVIELLVRNKENFTVMNYSLYMTNN